MLKFPWLDYMRVKAWNMDELWHLWYAQTFDWCHWCGKNVVNTCKYQIRIARRMQYQESFKASKSQDLVDKKYLHSIQEVWNFSRLNFGEPHRQHEEREKERKDTCIDKLGTWSARVPRVFWETSFCKSTTEIHHIYCTITARLQVNDINHSSLRLEFVL